MSADKNQWQSICKLDDIPAQGARVVKREGKTDIALFRTLDNRVFALDDHCPHKGGALSHGLVYGDTVACPLHNFKISLQTGQAQAPDEGHTPCHKVELRDDTVWLAVD
ncbi:MULTISPECIES: nitrite reductase small subunit NirD [Jeongeupia]|uniref:Nitrite reductase small subunit NirD n=2 Tax=Jeongeupia TaxID=885864 RepID=A0ABS2BJ72_9NEIS|nr:MULTISPECIES: nitrite reductase small subunit NirD [Jeongeupia]MBM3115649.1 nitrite reductase small subunit NirD [Jeongeupia naejangsanensis]GHD59265.1 nitrite reductase small subunit [Jeongeupia chitinilytica]